MKRGYIKLYRKTLESTVFGHEGLFKLWCLCLMKASHKEIEFTIAGRSKPIRLRPGQFITGRDALHYEYHQGWKKKKYNLRLSPSSLTLIRWLRTLEDMQMLNIKITNKFSIITITNWPLYQQKNAERRSGIASGPFLTPCTSKSQNLNIKKEGSEQGISTDSGYSVSKSEHQKVKICTSSDHKQECIKNNKESIEGKKPPSKYKVFQDWWFEKFRHRSGKDYIVTNWGRFGSQIKTLLKLPLSFEDLQYLAMEFFLDSDPFITGSEKGSGTGHNIGMFLIKINQNTYSKYRDPKFREKNRSHIVNEDGTLKYQEESEE